MEFVDHGMFYRRNKGLFVFLINASREQSLANMRL
jgi:hypothetical protein